MIQQASRYDLVCISHLRWDFVWQRPQHLMQRFSTQHNVLFVEEPLAVLGDGEPELVVRQVTPSIWVSTLHVPVPELGWISYDSPWQATYERAVAAWVRDWTNVPPVLWFYNPLPLGFISELQPAVVVYDVMDELRNFAGAPLELMQCEEELLRRADVVFTGGASIHRAKEPYNANTHLFPSGVEVRHFATALHSGTPIPSDIANLPAPRIGYYGVVDERLDLELLAEVAGARTSWSWVLIGPVLKIDPASLPVAPNLHYLGQRQYAELPEYLQGFDVTMMPFALNQATEYISPTKTLEYMAGDKPIVSTPIRDVIDLYGEGVFVAASPAEFVQGCEAAMQQTPDQMKCRQAVYKRLLAAHEWDDIAARMRDLVSAQLEARVSANVAERKEYSDERQ